MQTITGEIIPAEWARFRTFAARVRVLSYQPGAYASIDPLVWTILARKCRGEPLFPRLRLLDVPLVEREDFTPIFGFLSPSLRNVLLHFDSPTDPPPPTAGMKIIFQTLVDVAPELSELCWQAPPDMLPLEEASFMADISRLRHLRGLTLTQPYRDRVPPPPDQPAPTAVAAAPLQAIAAIRTLRTLVLDVDHVDADYTTKVVGNSTLEELRALRVIGGPAEKLVPLVHSLCLLALERFFLDTLQFDQHVPLAPLSSQLATLCANLPPTLQEFDWQYPTDRPPAPADAPPIDLLCMLRPLLRFTLLRRVVFGIPEVSSVYITDDALSHLAAAWPNIQTLQIISAPCLSSSRSSPVSDGIYPTFAALVTFAQCCPMLSSLILPNLDFSSVGSDPALSKSIPFMRQHPLHQLHVKAAVCGNIVPWGLAVLLDRLFPQLYRVYINPNHRTAGSPNFSTEIDNILKAMRSTREHVEMRAKLSAGEAAGDRSAAGTDIARA